MNVMTLQDQRHHTVQQYLESVMSKMDQNTFVDIGCSNGHLMRRLLNNHLFTRLIGIDTDLSTLEKATTVCFPSLIDERELQYFKGKD